MPSELPTMSWVLSNSQSQEPEQSIVYWKQYIQGQARTASESKRKPQELVVQTPTTSVFLKWCLLFHSDLFIHLKILTKKEKSQASFKDRPARSMHPCPKWIVATCAPTWDGPHEWGWEEMLPVDRACKKCGSVFQFEWREKYIWGTDIYELCATHMSWLVDHDIGKSKIGRLEIKNLKQVMWIDL